MANIPISSFTAAANATGIGMSGFSLTGANAQSMLDLAGTWNTSGTPTGLKLNVTDTASNAASLLMDLQVGGVSRAYITKTGNLFMRGNTQNWLLDGNNVPNQLGFYANGVAAGFAVTASGGVAVNLSFAATVSSTPDIILARDAANTLAQRNSTNAQTLRIYNTFTDASNYERGFMRWNANVLQIGSESAGTGVARSVTVTSADHLDLASAAARSVRIAPAGSTTWLFNSSGHLIAGADNTSDIGAGGGNRPRNLYMASWIRMATTTVASLPAAATAGAGARMFVTDAFGPVFGSAVVGGGAVTVPVYSTGSAWNVG